MKSLSKQLLSPLVAGAGARAGVVAASPPVCRRGAIRRRCAALVLGLLAAGFGARVQAGTLSMLVDTGTEMPVAQLHASQVLGGLQKDLGEALASRLGRTANFTALPRKRIAEALENGKADLLCMYLPEWLPGDFNWSQGFFPIVEVVISDLSVAAPHTLADLAGQTVGTVLGYSYPEMEQALGSAFVREDAPSAENNLRKMSIGRIHYALTTTAYLAYHLKTGGPMALHAPLVVKSYRTECAVSRRGQVSVGEVNTAIGQIVRDGTLNRILMRYQ
ncbi:MAG TPA: transporter substrate-binding domain-containing protein [Janthinobacterium sp.]|nr:transporter substrate-binding domain-containing protein [Janthinobacterium sp.]